MRKIVFGFALILALIVGFLLEDVGEFGEVLTTFISVVGFLIAYSGARDVEGEDKRD